MVRVLTVDPRLPSEALLRQAADLLRSGGIVAFPTETVYGLGANAFDARAVARIFRAKGRPASDPLIVHVGGIQDLAQVAQSVPPVALRLAEAFWPGPLTLIVPRASRLPGVVTANLDSVAVRAPAHPVAQALIAEARMPVAAPSANRFAHASPTTAEHVVDDLDDRIDLVLDAGPSPLGIESTVVDCRAPSPVVLRPGGISIEALSRVVANVRCGTPDGAAQAAGPEGARAEPPRGGPGRPEPPAGESGRAQRSPGQLTRHYAPSVPLLLVRGQDEPVRRLLSHLVALASHGALPARLGLLVADEDLPARSRPAPGGPVGIAPGIVATSMGSRTDLETVARHLYAGIRTLEAEGVGAIVACGFAGSGLGPAIDDRLWRAAAGRVVEATADDPDAAAREIVRWLPRT